MADVLAIAGFAVIFATFVLILKGWWWKGRRNWCGWSRKYKEINRVFLHVVRSRISYANRAVIKS